MERIISTSPKSCRGRRTNVLRITFLSHIMKRKVLWLFTMFNLHVSKWDQDDVVVEVRRKQRSTGLLQVSTLSINESLNHSAYNVRLVSITHRLSQSSLLYADVNGPQAKQVVSGHCWTRSPRWGIHQTGHHYPLNLHNILQSRHAS